MAPRDARDQATAPRSDCWAPWRQRQQWGDPRRRQGDFRRRQFGIWYLVILTWLAYAVAQAVAGFVRWVAGPAAMTRGGPFAIPLILVVAACVILAVGFFMRNVGSPLGDVVAASDRVASGDFAVRVREHGAPWMRSVARSFNSMTTRLEAQHRQRRELMADVAHELRTPLAAMHGRLEGMIDGVYPSDQTHVAQVLEDTRMLARLVEDLRTLAHSESGTLTLQRESSDLGGLVEEVTALYRAAADRRRVTLVAQVPSGVPLMEIDPVRIREVLANLISNGLRYSPPETSVVVSVEPGASAVVVNVSDSGPGIPEEDLPRIFDRFYKGASSNGSGLGLTIARNLVAAHGGTLNARRRGTSGTTFTFTLPIEG
jgi:two-component system OmpR family sensor kinase/two-component system sensor histidine kinase BaeS